MGSWVCFRKACLNFNHYLRRFWGCEIKGTEWGSSHRATWRACHPAAASPVLYFLSTSNTELQSWVSGVDVHGEYSIESHISAMRLPVDLHSYKYETQQEMGDDTHLLLCSCSGSKSACFFLKQVLNHHSLPSQLDSNLLFASPLPFFFSSFTFFAATHSYLGFPYLLCFHMIRVALCLVLASGAQ